MLRRTLAGLSPAIDAALAALPTPALERVATALVAATRHGYGPALAELDAWLDGRPLHDALLGAYVAQLVAGGCSHGAAVKVVAAARLRARLAGTECPVGPAASEVLAGFRRGGRAHPEGIDWKDLEAAVPRIEGDGPSGARDAAIIAIGSEAHLTVSEVIDLNVEDVVIEDDGTARLTVRRSRTDPEGDDTVAILEESTVRRLRAWLRKADIASGTMFRHMQSGRAGEDRMTKRGIRLLVTRRAHTAGIPAAALRPLAMGRCSPLANDCEVT